MLALVIGVDGPLILNSIDSVEQGCHSWTQNQDSMFDDFLSFCLTMTLCLISEHDDYATQLNSLLTLCFVTNEQKQFYRRAPPEPLRSSQLRLLILGLMYFILVDPTC